MPVLANEGVQTAGLRLNDYSSDAPFVLRCQCGLLWRVLKQRGAAGKPGCVPCSCGSALVAWSGTVAFTASLVKTVSRG